MWPKLSREEIIFENEHHDRCTLYGTPLEDGETVAFGYAHKQLHAIEADELLIKQMQKEYEAAHHKAPNGKTYTTAHAWKFNSLLCEWKQVNPFEE